MTEQRLLNKLPLIGPTETGWITDKSFFKLMRKV